MGIVVHRKVIAGEEQFRAWSTITDSYETEVLTREGLKFCLMEKNLLRALMPDPGIEYYDLDGDGWHEQMPGRPSGKIELYDVGIGPAKADLPTMNDVWLSALRKMPILTSALDAYNQHVKEGGNPKHVPIMKFENGAFLVELHETEE